MDVYSDLISAGMEKLAAHPANTFKSRFYFNTTSNMPYYHNGTKWEVFTSIYNKVDAIIDPVVTDDSASGFEVGSLFFNTVSKDFFMCIADTVGAAVWRPVENQKCNYTAVVAPAENDDALSGYSIGSKWVVSADHSIFFCVDASAGAAVWSQGGGGLGSLDYFYSENFDVTKTADLTVTGTITVADNEATPLGDGKRSIKVTQVAGSLGATVKMPVIPIGLNTKEETVGFSGRYKYSGENYEMAFVLYDETNAKVFDRVLLSKEDISNTLRLIVTTLSTTANMSCYFEVMTENIGAVLEFVNIEGKINPLPTAESVESGSILHSAIKATTTGTNPIQFNSANFSDENFERFATYSAGVWTAVADFKLGYTLSFVNSIAGQRAALMVNGTTVNNENGVNAPAGNGYVNSSGVYPIKSGQTFEFFTSAAIASTSEAVNLQLTATASSSNVVFEGEDTDNIGLISMQAAELATPKNHLYCNGDAVSRNGYADLFAKVGTTYGVGDGSTTFNLPDMRGYFPRGYDDGRGVDAARVFGTEQAGQSNHLAQVHEFTQAGASATDVTVPSDGTFTAYIKNYVTSEGMRFRTHGRETRPHNIAVKFYIRYAEKEILSVPVTNLVENVYSAKFNGRASFSDESASFVESRSFTGGVSTITWKAGHFTTAPNVIVSSANDNVNAIAYNITTTGCSVILNTTNSLTNIDVPFNMIVQRQGADYIAPKGYFLGNMAYGVGVAQTWQDVLASRAITTDYVNDTNAPIQVKVTASVMVNGNTLRILVDGLIIDEEMTNSGNMIRHSVSAIVPKGSTYSIELTHGVSSLVRWHELR